MSRGTGKVQGPRLAGAGQFLQTLKNNKFLPYAAAGVATAIGLDSTPRFLKALSDGQNVAQATSSAISGTLMNSANMATGGMVDLVSGAGELLKGSTSDQLANKINEVKQKVDNAKASGNVGEQLVAEQELQQLLATNKLSTGGYQPQDQSDYVLKQFDDVFKMSETIANAADKRERSRMQFQNDMLNRNADIQFRRNYAADAYKSNNTMFQQALIDMGAQGRAAMAEIGAAARMRY